MTRQPIHRSPRLLSFALVSALPLLIGSAAAAADGDAISVMVDRAKVMHVSRPASIVIIGNPAIADATIQDNQTLIITGKSFGTTNLIVLDSTGQPIADSTLTVEASDDNVVTIYRRSARATFSCTPNCSPTLALGDTAGTFDSVNSQIQAHNSLSDAATK